MEDRPARQCADHDTHSESTIVNSGDNIPGGAPPTFAARLACGPQAARRLAEQLADRLDPEEVAVSAYEQPDGWQVEIVFATAPDVAELRSLIGELAGPAAADGLTFGDIATRDWVAASLEGLAPVEAGRFVVHGGHDRVRVPANRIGIEIEAALAFGTGHHGTTRGCLLALDRHLKHAHPRRILDVGTGSGVLAIAAARALRAPVSASDIDPLAVLAARSNARLNRAGAWVRAIHAAGLTDARLRAQAPFDLIFANILLAPLKRLSRPASALLVPGGTIILSGLLDADEAPARSAYRAQGLALVARIELEGWVTLVMKRPGAPDCGSKTATPRREPGRC